MGDKHQRIPIGALKGFMADVFTALGIPSEDAGICADVLAAADRMGIDSHGISRLKSKYCDLILAGLVNPVTDMEILRETPTTTVIDGHNGMGHVIASRGMEIAIRKAAEYGIGMTAVRNSTHFGIAGYYSLMAADRGMIGITGTNARPSTAPTWGTRNLLGTNPLAFAMPTDEGFPFLLDCATSVTQRGKIEVRSREGKEVPAGWAIDSDGRPLTDPDLVLKGFAEGEAALLPLGGDGELHGGHKGYGFATLVEILSSALQAGSYMGMLSGIADGHRSRIPIGHFFIAVDISAFIEAEEFRRRTGDILRELRASRKVPGAERIYTPGEKEHLTSLERERDGIPVSEGLMSEIGQMIRELDLDDHGFPI